jgi:FixJ family two-component response regulator
LISEFAQPATAATANRAALAGLTLWEREVLELVAPGMPNNEVARHLVLSPGDREEPREPHPHQARRVIGRSWS